MEVSSLGNFAAAQKQTTETSEGNKDARPAASAESQGTTTEEAQNSPIPPVNQAAGLSGEEGNTVAPELSSGAEVDLLA